MSRKRMVATAAVLAGALVLTACGGGGELLALAVAERAGGETLKIGFMGDLTGENSGIVIPPRNGAKLAIDEYNATNPAAEDRAGRVRQPGQRRPGGPAGHPGHPAGQDRRPDRPGVLR